MSESSDTLLTATVHGVKNQLGELLWRLEARGDCQVEQSITLRCAQRLSSALLLGRDASAGLALSLDATDADALLEDIASEYRSLFPQLQVDCEAPGSAASGEPRMVFVDRPLVTLVLAMSCITPAVQRAVALCCRRRRGVGAFALRFATMARDIHTRFCAPQVVSCSRGEASVLVWACSWLPVWRRRTDVVSKSARST